MSGESSPAPWLDLRPSQLQRHPADGWSLPEPLPLGVWTRRSVAGVIRAMMPIGAAGAPVDAATQAEVDLAVRVTLRCMQPPLARGLILLFVLLDLAPIWAFAWRPRLGGLRRLCAGDGPNAEAVSQRDAALLEALSHCAIGALRDAVTAARAAVLTAYYDLPQVQRAIGHDPLPHLRDRIALRQRLLQGGAATAADHLSPTAADVGAWGRR